MPIRVEDRKVVVGTGTSRDVGKFFTYGFAQAGWDVIGGFKNPDHLDQHLAFQKEIQGGYKIKYDFVQGDVTDPSTADAYVNKVIGLSRGVDALILNAAGGYKRRINEKTPEEIAGQFAESERINVDAQLTLLGKLRSHLNPGAVVIYATSDPAHRAHILTAGGKEPLDVFGDYATVADKKNRAEQILRGMIPELADEDVRLGFVVGNGLDGSFVTRALKRSNPQVTAEWMSLAEDGVFPTVMDMSTSIVRVARANRLPSGHTEYVGIAPQNQLYPQNLSERLSGPPPLREGSVLTLDQIYRIIPHRWPFMLLGSVSEVEFGKRARGTLVDLTHPDINWQRGHFPDGQVVPGAITQEAVSQLGALTVLGLPENRDKIAVLTGVNVKVRNPIRPGEPAQLEAEIGKSRGPFGVGRVKALNAEGKTALVGEISYAVVNRDKIFPSVA